MTATPVTRKKRKGDEIKRVKFKKKKTRRAVK
jgi:hypothetical protein